jgi:hypothetical protein
MQVRDTFASLGEGRFTSRLLPGGESAAMRREISREQRAQRRLMSRRRRRERWLARRRRRQLAGIERQLLGRTPRHFAGWWPFAGRERQVTREASGLEAKVGRAVEAALERHREELWAEFQRVLDVRLRLAVEAAERRGLASERRISEETRSAVAAASEQNEKAINRVSSEMWRSMDRRLSREAKRIEKEVERSVGVEMGRMYLRLSRPADPEVLRGRRR